MGRGSAVPRRKSDSDEYLPTGSGRIKHSKPSKEDAQAIDDADAAEIGDEEHDQDELTAEALKIYSKGIAKNAKAKLPVTESAINKFTASVDERKRVLLSLLEEKSDKISTLHAEAFSTLVSFAQEQTLLPLSYCQEDHTRTSPATAPPPPMLRPKLTTLSHPYHEQSLRLLNRCNIVLEDYKSIAKVMDHYKEQLKVGEHWHADKQQLLQVLEAGKRHTIEEIKKRMLREEKDTKGKKMVVKQKIQEWEVDERLVKRFSKEEGIWKALYGASGEAGEGVEGQSWAENAEKMERGVKRLARCLPKETEVEERWA